MERPSAISTRGLTKRYGRISALEALDLDIPEGSIAGLLGRSGSGRTTTLRLLAGLIRPTGGSATVAGIPLDDGHGVEIRRRMGVLPASDAIYEWMSGREQVSFAAELAGLSRTEIPDRVDDVLDRVGLGVLADARTSLYDLADRRRLGLAQALVGEPEVVLLDEPVSALDPATRTEVLGILHRLRGQATVVFSSADAAEVEAICDHVAALDAGRLVVAGSVDELLGAATRTGYLLYLERMPGPAHAGLVARLRNEPWVQTVDVYGLVLRISVRDDHVASRELLPAVVAAGLPVASFRRERPTLADAIAEVAARGSPVAGSVA